MSTKTAPLPPTPDEKFIDAMNDEASSLQQFKTKRTHHAEFPTKDIIVVPEENYRWGGVEGMEADMAMLDVVNADGTRSSSFEILKRSIATLGVEDPVGLVKRNDGYHVVYGFTRTVVAKQVGLKTLPAYVYDSSLPDSEFELLQGRENTAVLKRNVNWVAETELYISLVERMVTRLVAGNDNAGTRKAAQGKARAVIERVLGRAHKTMKNQTHYLQVIDKRVINLCRAGHMKLKTAIEFHSGDVGAPFDPKYVTAVLRQLMVKGVYPTDIALESVQRAKKYVDLNGVDLEASDDSDVDVGAEPLPYHKAQNTRFGDKTRQNPGCLRDVAGLMAYEDLLHRKLTLTNTAEEVQKVVNGRAWNKITGVGFGAGEVLVPPLMEVVLHGKSGEVIDRQQRAHEVTSYRYAVAAYLHAFVRQALKGLGYPNMDSDDKGWISGKSKGPDGFEVTNRELYTKAIFAGVDMPDDTPLILRAKETWKRIRPNVPKRLV